VATPRKRKPSKRKTNAKRRRPSLLLIAGLGALIAGFLVRRSLLPSAMYRLTHREPDHQSMPVVLPNDEPPPIEETHKSMERPKYGAEHPPTETTGLEAPMKSRDTNSSSEPETAAGEANPAHNVEHEHISASDREQLDTILKRRAK
jgi:hypothetical protein